MQLVVAKEHEAIANGDLPWLIVPGLLVYPVPGGDPECCDVTLDATQTYFCRNDDVEDLTRQIVDQHRQVQWFAAFLKKYVPGFEKSAISAVASMNGVRDSRRIVGEYIFTDADMARGAKFDDGIARNPEFFDAHHPTCGDYVAVRHIHLRRAGGGRHHPSVAGRRQLPHAPVRHPGRLRGPHQSRGTGRRCPTAAWWPPR